MTTTTAADDLTTVHASAIAASTLPVGHTDTPAGMSLVEIQDPEHLTTTATVYGPRFGSPSFGIESTVFDSYAVIHSSVHRAESLTLLGATALAGDLATVTLAHESSTMTLYTRDRHALAANLIRAAAALLDLDA